MTLPQWHEFLDPVIRLLADGTERTQRDVEEAMARQFQFSEEDLALQDIRNKPIWRGRVYWAIYGAYRAGLLEKPGRGLNVISAAGKQAAASPITITRATLAQSESYQQWMKASRSKKKSRPDDSGQEVLQESEETPEESLVEAAEQINEALTDEIYAALHTVAPAAFETLILKVVQAMGYGTDEGIRKTGGTGDKGIDGIIWQDALGFDRVYLQAKRYSAGNNVQSKEIRDFGGALMQQRAAKGIFITTSEFASGAEQAAKDISHASYQIVLIDGRRLAYLMLKYRVGVQQHVTVTTYKLDSEFYENLEQGESTAK